MGTRLMHETYPLSWRDFSHHRSHDISSEAHLQPADIHVIFMKLRPAMLPQVAVKNMWTSSDLCLAVFMMPASARSRRAKQP